MIRNVNRDTLRVALHNWRAAAHLTANRGRAPTVERDVTAADSDADRATRTITHQSEKHTVSADLGRFLFQPLERFRFVLGIAVEERGATRRVDHGDLFVIARWRLVDADGFRTD